MLLTLDRTWYFEAETDDRGDWMSVINSILDKRLSLQDAMNSREKRIQVENKRYNSQLFDALDDSTVDSWIRFEKVK